MKKKYTINYFQYFFVHFVPVFFAFLLGSIFISISSILTIIEFIVYGTSPADNFLIYLLALIPSWKAVYDGWKEFRFPVIWLSETGITALAIAFLPIKVHISWENILGVSDKKTLQGTYFGYGTSVSINLTGKAQYRIFKITGGNEIFISNKMAKYDELVDSITEKIK